VRRARFIGEVLAGEGVAERVGTTVRGGHHDESGLTMELGDGDQHAAERLLVTTGRRTDLAGLDGYRLPLSRARVADR
jgi:pyruvate/2-oxoglutarate dehydrogenase complex dihydrolipoamide dehydrogenase (E3) component